MINNKMYRVFISTYTYTIRNINWRFLIKIKISNRFSYV